MKTPGDKPTLSTSNSSISGKSKPKKSSDKVPAKQKTVNADKKKKETRRMSIKTNERLSKRLSDNGKLDGPPNKLAGTDSNFNDAYSQITQLLQKYKIDKRPIFDENFCLHLDLEKNFNKVIWFLRDSKNLSLPTLKKVGIIHQQILDVSKTSYVQLLFMSSD